MIDVTSAPRRAAILARVSSDGQDVDSQLADMRARVARDGALLDERRHIYVDDGVSGKTGNLHARADLLRMIRDLEERPRPWDVLYFFEYDRLARTEDIEEQGRILGPLQRAGVDLITRSGLQPALSTSLGRIWAHWQLEAAAEWLSKHKAQIKRGKDAAIAAGKKPAGPTPYGHTYDRATGTWGIDEAAQKVITEILDRIRMGESCWTIGEDIEARGVRRPRGGKWTRERTWQLARSRHLIGEWTADKRRGLVIKVPAIVPRELWDDAQAALDSYGLRGKPRAKHVRLLEGIARCGVCQGPIWISAGYQPARGGRYRPAYYVCRSRIRGPFDETRCKNPMRRVDDIDVRVWARITAYLAAPDLLEETLGERSDEAGRDARDWEGDLRGFERQLAELDTRERQLVDRFARGLIGEDVLDATLKRNKERRELLRRNVDNARARLVAAARTAEHAELLLATTETLRARVQDADAETRRDLVRLLIPGSGDHVATILADGRVRLGVRDLAAVAGVCTPAAAGYNSARRANGVMFAPIRLIA